jgi:hypothetical protein
LAACPAIVAFLFTLHLYFNSLSTATISAALDATEMFVSKKSDDLFGIENKIN